MLHNGVPLHSLGALEDAPDDWTAAADQLIGTGVTRIKRDKAATVLAELAAGTAVAEIVDLPSRLDLAAVAVLVRGF